MLRYVTIIALLYFSASALAHDSGAAQRAMTDACQKKLTKRNFMKREALIDSGMPGGDMAQWSAEEVEEYYRTGGGTEPAIEHTPPPQWDFPLPGGYRPNWPPAEKP